MTDPLNRPRTLECKSPAPPDFTQRNNIRARHRIAAMLVAGLPLPTVESLFGFHEGEFRFPEQRTEEITMNTDTNADDLTIDEYNAILQYPFPLSRYLVPLGLKLKLDPVVIPQTPPDNVCVACVNRWIKYLREAIELGVDQYHAIACPHTDDTGERYNVAFVVRGETPSFLQLNGIKPAEWNQLYEKLLITNASDYRAALDAVRVANPNASIAVTIGSVET